MIHYILDVYLDGEIYQLRYAGINLLYPPFKLKVLSALAEARSAGIPLQIFETLRSRERQAYIYAKGRTTPGPKRTGAKPGRSFHQYGIAVDCVLWIDGRWSWAETNLYRDAGPIFEKHGLTWLGRTSGDLVHFQYKTHYDIDDLENIYSQGGFEGVWLKLDAIA